MIIYIKMIIYIR